MKSTSQLLRNYRETCNIPFSLSTYLKKYYEKEVGEKLLLIIINKYYKYKGNCCK